MRTFWLVRADVTLTHHIYLSNKAHFLSISRRNGY